MRLLSNELLAAKWGIYTISCPEIESRVTNAINAVSENHPELINDKAWMWSALMEELETGDLWQELLTRRGLSDLRETVKARLSDKAEAEIERMSAGLLEVVEVRWMHHIVPVSR